MSSLERVIPTPRLLEVHAVDLALPVERAWEIVRHGNLAGSRLIHALFALRTLPARLAGRHEEAPSFRIDDLESSAERPGFQVLVDDGPRELVVGAIGKVWRLNIPFVHVDGAEAFAAFSASDFVKVAWAIQLFPRGPHGTHLSFEVRVDATDVTAWRKFRRYFSIIGPASHFIRRSLLAGLARQYGTPESKREERALPGDELLLDAEQVTHCITIAAPPEKVWPWLVQMGCRRAGFYGIDALDNGGVPSAREIHPELQNVQVGDVVAATPKGDDGFEVLRVDPNRALVLGGLYDTAAKAQLAFASRRPRRYWHATWAFCLEPLDASTTLLLVRARVAFSADARLHKEWIQWVHHFMQTSQLRHLAARAEGRMRADGWRDVAGGVGGAAIAAAAFLSPFLRESRSHWGIDASIASLPFQGDEIIEKPRWGWTHGVEVEAPAEVVWPWVAQIGADRAGFYSYQWLENVAGCKLRNAETIHPEWAHREGDFLRLHPDMPPLRVVSLAPGRYMVAHAPANPAERSADGRWAEVTWGFFVDPVGPRRCRVISRYRLACSDDLASRLQLGPMLVEPIGFAMDRRMLLGIKERAERRARTGLRKVVGQ